MTKQPLPPAVSLRGLTKRYGDRAAVEDLTIDVPAGVVAGFVGPNGAGKTTTMAMLLGLVTPTEGTGSVLGAPLADPASYLGRVGALIEGPAFYPGLTGAQNLAVLATAGGHDPAEVPELLELVGLGERGDDRFRRYSFGMKQRLGIAGALLGDPSLLILDEPINGLDPAGVHEMRGLIGRLASGERTVLVSSHVLAELEQVCDWLIVIDGGRLIFQGPADELLDRTGARLVVAPEHPADLDRLGGLLAAAGHDGRTSRRPPGDRRERIRPARPRGRREPRGGLGRDRPGRAARRPHQPRGPLPDDDERRRTMITMFKAELLKLRRRRVAAAVAITALAFAAIASAGVFLSATESGAPGSERGATVASLGQAGGATAAFAIGTSFVGILVLVLFIANVAGEFSQGTFRTLLMRQPRRVGLLAGKMAALLVLAAIVLALALVLTVAASAAIAPARMSRRPRGSASTASARRRATTRPPCSASPRGPRSAWPSRSSCARSRSPWPSGSCGRARSSTSSRTRGAPRGSGSPDCCSRRSPPAARPTSRRPGRSCSSPSTSPRRRAPPGSCSRAATSRRERRARAPPGLERPGACARRRRSPPPDGFL